MNIIGIDLGTTYSAVSAIDAYGRPELLTNSDGERLTPSAVCFGSDGSVLTGAEAKEMLDAGEPDVAVFFKRTMGMADYLFTAGNSIYSPSDISAILLRRLAADAEAKLGGPIDRTVITVPAYYGNAERLDVMEAARKAGLRNVTLCHEPTAAALSYGLSNRLDGYYMVYDLGGGTFDVSVLEVHGTNFRILAVNGDHQLGGKDWDDMIVTQAMERFQLNTGFDLSEDLEAYNQLVFSAERLKKQLSVKDSASMIVRCRGQRMKYELTRAEFEAMTEYLMASTTMKSEEALSMASLTWSELQGVLLVGGSTRMPVVADWVRRMSGKEPLRGVNPDEAVCLGAAVCAAMELTKKADVPGMTKAPEPRYSIAGSLDVVDVMSYSLGALSVSADGTRYVNSIVIPRNKPIPATVVRPFEHTTSPGRSNELEIYLIQGESENPSDCRIEARYVVPSIPHSQTGKVIVDIGYSYDSNGMLQVSVSDHDTGRIFDVESRPLPDDMSWLDENPKLKAGAIDVVVLIDESGSMMGNAIRKAADAARNFCSMLNNDCSRVSICGFTHKVTQHCGLTSSMSEQMKAIDKLRAYGGNGYDALSDAYEILKKSERDTKRVIIVLTDGEWYADKAPYYTSDTCRKEGIDIIALGFGDANKAFLKRISTISVMTDLNSLAGNFSTIARELSAGTDVKNIQLR